MRRVLAGIRRHPRLTAGGGVVLVGLAVFVLVWFQPQKLFIDDKVDEALPVAAGAPEQAGRGEPATTATTAPPEADTPVATVPPTTVPAGPTVLARGEFRGIDHGTSGTALLLDVGDGRRVVRFENLDTSNGPDLRVYLSAAPSTAEEGAFDDDFVDLGGLKGNIGNQNYEVPEGVDAGRFASVVVWCRRFTSAFGVAPLTPA